MALQVDDAAKQTLVRIASTLRAARKSSGLTQEALSSGLSVRGRAISEWETGLIEPTLVHLVQWSGELGLRLAIAGPGGTLHEGHSRQRPGEAWEAFERRRLAELLRVRRVALGLSQEDLSRLVGVSRDSIQRWELAHVPPRPISHIVWAQKLGRMLTLVPIDTPDPRLHHHTVAVPDHDRTAAAELGDETPAPAVATGRIRRYAARRAGSC